jgi:hypothetical protein
VNNPCDSRYVHLLVEGVKRLTARPVCKKEPITPEILREIVLKYGLGSNLMHIRLCTMCLISFAGFLRHNELVNIKEGDIVICDSFIKIFLTKSKTDQYREGAWVIVAETGTITCPVGMLKKYFLLGNLGQFPDKYVFRPVSFLKSSQVYRLREGQLSYSRCREIYKDALYEVGVDPKLYGLHSLRSGGASAASAVGVPDRLFKKHGRWQSDSAKDGYVRESMENQMSVSMNLGL